MKTTQREPRLQELRDQLRTIRRQSLEATRSADYQRVARLTVEAARINKILGELEGFRWHPRLS
jgi:hypothetical protein